PAGPARRLRRYACTRFQQLTSPAAAKAVEDTACYRSGVLLSRNDVGFDPQIFSAPVESFHARCLERAEHFPQNLLTTATHDHKRGEDTRARMAVISERAEWFAEKARHWRQLAYGVRQQLADGPAPSPGDELLLYQILLGSWPLELFRSDQAGVEAYCERIGKWLEKALREAKLRTSWTDPNSDYESACQQYLRALLLNDECRGLRQEIADAAAELAPAGALNSLTQTLLRMTTPGVPDLYQGTDYWDFSLVDPDNRQPVDFARRQATFNPQAQPDELLANWKDGRIKQWLIARCLNLRSTLPALFSEGSYLPLKVEGSHADRVIAFARVRDGTWLIVIAARLATPLLADSAIPQIAPELWQDTSVQLPEVLSGRPLMRLSSANAVTPNQTSLHLQQASGSLPVASLQAPIR